MSHKHYLLKGGRLILAFLPNFSSIAFTNSFNFFGLLFPIL